MNMMWCAKFQEIVKCTYNQSLFVQMHVLAFTGVQHGVHIGRCSCRLTNTPRVPQELHSLPEHRSAPAVFNGVCVAQSFSFLCSVLYLIVCHFIQVFFWPLHFLSFELRLLITTSYLLTCLICHQTKAWTNRIKCPSFELHDIIFYDKIWQWVKIVLKDEDKIVQHKLETKSSTSNIK